MSYSRPAPSNTLLKRSSAAPVVSAVADVLDRPAETDLLVVSYRDGPSAWLRRFRSHVGGPPPEVGFVVAGAETRSTEGATPSASPSRSDGASPCDAPPATVPVGDPTDLGRVGVRASEFLDAWNDGRLTVVVLDSVTAMLDAVGLDRAFEFLHLLAGRVESVEGRGYYLVDPSAHDDRALTVVRELADRVVDLDAAAE